MIAYVRIDSPTPWASNLERVELQELARNGEVYVDFVDREKIVAGARRLGLTVDLVVEDPHARWILCEHCLGEVCQHSCVWVAVQPRGGSHYWQAPVPVHRECEGALDYTFVEPADVRLCAIPDVRTWAQMDCQGSLRDTPWWHLATDVPFDRTPYQLAPMVHGRLSRVWVHPQDVARCLAWCLSLGDWSGELSVSYADS